MDAFSQLDQVASKRSALEKLIDIAMGIQGQQQALEDLALIAKPSQELPSKTHQYMAQFEAKYAQVTDEELRQRLKLIESAIQGLIKRLVLFAQQEVTALRDEQLEGFSVDGFKQRVAEFAQHTKKSLILRFLLKKRGMPLVAFRLPFPQESIAEQIQDLKEREGQCIAQIRAEAQSIIDDTRRLLAGSSVPDSMRPQLQAVQKEMQANLRHLDKGGSVATLPSKFEVLGSPSTPLPAAAEERVDLPVRPPKTVPVAAEQPVKTKPNNTPVEPVRRKKLSGMQLLIKWLMTPWGRSFKSLREENENRDG